MLHHSGGLPEKNDHPQYISNLAELARGSDAVGSQNFRLA
jgi:hypothetical protein